MNDVSILGRHALHRLTRVSASVERVELVVNGEPRSLDVEPRTLLVHALRDGLGLTGTHIGCDTSQCGACTVLVGGRAVKSCTLLALQLEGSEVTTIEGLASGDGLHPIQRAFVEHHGLQCGYCTPGMILTTADLLSREAEPDDETIRRSLRGNYCRCTGYHSIVDSIRAAGVALRSGAPA
jgi:carbon-monoxide dehydrogenase small subunit